MDIAQNEDPLLAGFFNSGISLSGMDFLGDYVADATSHPANAASVAASVDRLSTGVDQMRLSPKSTPSADTATVDSNRFMQLVAAHHPTNTVGRLLLHQVWNGRHSSSSK